MRKISVIGIGAGDPDYITLGATRALAAVDVFFVPDKGEDKSDLSAARLDAIARWARPGHSVHTIAMPERDRLPSDYRETVDDWHRRIADAYAMAFADALPEGAHGGLLVWGDPSLYDSTLRILDRLRADGAAFDLDVVPGISAAHALCARHRIPLNAIGEPVAITTGRQLSGGWPSGATAALVMLDGVQAFLQYRRDDLEIFWGAYLGTPDEVLLAGPLDGIADAIVAARAEARARKGWIMDTYLLRRRAGVTANGGV